MENVSWKNIKVDSNLLILDEDKNIYTSKDIFLKDNVHFTTASVVKFNNKIYSTDGCRSLDKTKDELFSAINNEDDVIINISHNDRYVAVIIPISLDSKLIDAIEKENYELASIIQKEINKNR